MEQAGGPLTLGTAGHVDHGKTALVAALTGIDTDRLPEEKARGLTIALGYAPLPLPGGRSVSLVDVPGHERFVRTMVAGATGIDAFLMVIAADDGVMPQTREHAEVLRALAVDAGVVAITKTDLADPAPAIADARELLGECQVVPVCARTGAGLADLLGALGRLAAKLKSRAGRPAGACLHVDRVFTIAGRGTVATGTLWSGRVAVGDVMEIAPSGTVARVRGLEIHDQPVDQAPAGQRVAINLTGVRVSAVRRGDVLCAPGLLRPVKILDCQLSLDAGTRDRERVQVHHGTRAVSGRIVQVSDDGLWQLRLEQPLLPLAGDRVVVRRLAPATTLGGGVVLDIAAGRHGRRTDIATRLRALRDGHPAPAPPSRSTSPATQAAGALRPVAPPLDDAALALADGLRVAWPRLLSEAQISDDRSDLRRLRDAGVAVRVSGRLYGHTKDISAAEQQIVALLGEQGEITLPGTRDALGIPRKTVQALLEHLDSTRVTRRLPDDRRVPFGTRNRTSASAERAR